MLRAVAIAFISILIFSSSSFAQFKDVPVGHWSNKAIYDLVKKGITQGYPDGTFRGNNNMTRYETAIFLSKLAALAGFDSSSRTAVDEKLIAEFRSEIAGLKASLKEVKEAPEAKVSGSIQFDYISGSTLSDTRESASVLNCRVKTRIEDRERAHV